MNTLTKFSILLGIPLIISPSVQSRSSSSHQPVPENRKFTSDFRIQDCKFNSTGVNPFFNLTPGRIQKFAGEENGGKLELTITVLNETKDIVLPDVGAIQARVIEESEFADGIQTEVSRNFFAICEKTNDVYYFGEEVDIFEEDGTVTHEGAWEAGVNDAKPGIIMPGTFLLGSRYMQENAPGVAQDQAEHAEDDLKITTPAGSFEKCVKVVETTPLEPGNESEKEYCPDVGLVTDDVLKLIEVQNPAKK